MKNISEAPRGYEIPEGWQPGLPSVWVDTSVIKELGMPEVDYPGIDTLYGGELGLHGYPTTILGEIPSSDPLLRHLNVARYGSLTHTVNIDPVQMAHDGDPAGEIVAHMFWMGAIARQHELHPLRAKLPIGKSAIKAAALQARENRHLIAAYATVLRFPDYPDVTAGLDAAPELVS